MKFLINKYKVSLHIYINRDFSTKFIIKTKFCAQLLKINRSEKLFQSIYITRICYTFVLIFKYQYAKLKK